MLPVLVDSATNIQAALAPERTDALRRSVPNLVYDATVPGAGHDDIFLRPELEPAMREALARVGG